ncbi:MAG: NADP-dependent oxidoreductase [Dehalococcoidia bacterium]
MSSTTDRATNRRLLMVRRPVGMVQDTDFELRESPVPEPGPGEFLVRTIYLSMVPAMRSWMRDRASYVAPMQLGDLMRASGAGVVVVSNHPDYKPGDLVRGQFGWQDYVLTDGRGEHHMEPAPAGVPLATALSVLETTGLTAYFGLFDIGRPMAGDTVVVSGAAGGVGMVAGQLAWIAGCRAVGIAGSAEKCAWLVNELGFDAAINYRTEHVSQRLKATCPDGIDVFFDNVGGQILDAALMGLAMRARVVLCGAVSVLNATERQPGPSHLIEVIVRRARMEGFILTDYRDRFPEAMARMTRWLHDGRLKTREDIVEGLEHAPAALRSLFEGGNTGKLLLKVSDEPA